MSAHVMLLGNCTGISISYGSPFHIVAKVHSTVDGYISILVDSESCRDKRIYFTRVFFTNIGYLFWTMSFYRVVDTALLKLLTWALGVNDFQLPRFPFSFLYKVSL